MYLMYVFQTNIIGLMDAIHDCSQFSVVRRTKTGCRPVVVEVPLMSSPPKTDKDHKKFMADRINLLRGSVDAASHSPQRICIVTDASNPSLPLQSVVAFRLWHEGDLYDDWSAAGLSTSDNAELRAIADGVRQAYNVGLEDVRQVHVFSNSANALHLTMDASHHSGQHASLSICKVLVPWL
jgi:hypothetical protein